MHQLRAVSTSINGWPTAYYGLRRHITQAAGPQTENACRINTCSARLDPGLRDGALRCLFLSASMADHSQHQLRLFQG